MKRSRSKSVTRLTPDAERLLALAVGLGASGSLTEDRFWETQIAKLLGRLLDSGHDNAINSALDHLFHAQNSAYDGLIDQVESFTESAVLKHDGQMWDILLIAAPAVAWSKYSIPSGAIHAEAALRLATHLHAHVMASRTRVALSPFLYSIDQLPRSFTDVRKLTVRLGEAALSGTAPKLDFQRLAETANMLADTRFLLAAVAAPHEEALFRWQEPAQSGGPAEHNSRAHCLEQWITQGRPNLAPLLTGCVFECLLPEAYYVSCREADRRVRPYAIRAAAAFLENALKVKTDQLRAVVAGFGAERIDEYRIGLTLRGKDEVAYGTLWPLYGREDESATPGPTDEIAIELRSCGITDVLELKGLYTPEYCDDCGAPLFPAPDGEIVHAGLPEEAETSTVHFH